MKKILSLVLTLILAMGMMSCSVAEETKGEGVMTYAEYAAAELDAEVVAATKAAGYDNLKGHKSVGGLRASTYNAMPKEGVEALVDFLKKYEAEHK